MASASKRKVDDTVDSLDDEIKALEDARPPFPLDTSASTIIVVDNIPKVSGDKYDKLFSVLRKVFTALVGALKEPDGLYLPRDESGSTMG